MSTYEPIYAVVRRIPRGRVSSYGRVALLAGRPGAARLVGYALHALSDGDALVVPWWRVVNHTGFISNKYEAALQRDLLLAEGVAVDDGDRVDMGRHLWDGG
jgi:methylated-DNA-protein-cysteine methyltransferase-like protein